MNDTIKSALKKIIKPGGFDAQTERGIVLSVDKTAYTCVVELVSSEAILQDVKLKPVVNDGDSTQLGLVIFPALQSFVTVALVDDDNTDVVVTGFTVIESISLDTATALKMLITADGKIGLNAVLMTFNNGKNGGVPLLNPLTAVILKLQQQVNELANAFKLHTHPVIGTATGPTVTPSPAPIAPLIKSTDIENKSIVQ